MKHIIQTLFLVVGFSMIGCQDSKENNGASEVGTEVTGKSVVVQLQKAVAVGDWIEIDGLRLQHVTNDSTVTVLDPTRYDPMFVRADEEKDSLFYTLGALSYVPLGPDKWVSKLNNRGIITSNLLKAINVASNPSGNQPVYNFAGDIIIVLAGRLEISRSDGSALTIKTSKNYPALLSVLE